MYNCLRNHLWVFLLLISLSGSAQFTINETFRGSSSTGVTLGGSATLTSGNVDPVGNGWLRLTPSTTNQLGYGIVNATFPSTLGVLVDFEYTAWRTSSSGADGFSVFLYDASVLSFNIGGTGGSLGYAQNTLNPSPGLSGGYIGIGVDEFGNYSSNVNGKIGGPGNTPNAVAVRGPAPNYSYITGAQIIPSDAGTGDNGGIDYNSVTSTRPTQAQFYRRLQFTITPSGGSYALTVKWKTSPTGNFVTLLGPTTLATAPPPTLKVGFAASTGSFINTHEIRNVIITTPGNVRVNKSGPLNMNYSGSPVSMPYQIVVANGTAGTVTGISFSDPLPPNYTAALADISVDNHGNPTNQMNGIAISPAGEITGSINLAANEEITITVNGKLSSFPPGGNMTNTVQVGSGNITDLDLTNNVSEVTTQVISTLPVTLKSFGARKTDNQVLLEWIAAGESNFSHFGIERSSNGTDFTLLQEVAAQSGSSDKNYRYADQQAPPGTLYYRLKMVDIDGAFTYSVIKKIDNIPDNTNWKAYPNPASDKVMVMLPAGWQQGRVDWDLVDMAGMKLASGASISAAMIRVPVAAYPNGRYQLVFRHTGKGLIYSLPLQIGR